MTREEAKSLFKKYRSGKCTPEEIALLEDWYTYYAAQQDGRVPDELRMSQDLDEVWQSLPVHRSNSIFSSRNRRRIAAAAAILLVGAFLALIGPRLLSEHESPASEGQTLSAVTGLSEPAEAYIKLDDGQVIALNSRVSGNIYSDKVTSINKIGGRLSYDPVSQRGYSAGISEEVPQYHTVVIPKGQQYELILPDGTHVWLNSLSSITFPVRFSRADRTVEITGEAYFEVVHEAERPFLVTAGEQQVKVLGTRFNINAYDDEEIIRTTLVEGKVEVRVPSAGYQPDREIVRVLHPGQQSRFSSDAGRLNVVAVDVHNAIAWKGGLILFEGASIESILRQVSRWYDIDVEYVGTPSDDRRFTGGVSRNAPLSEFLRVLELNEVDFSFTGSTLQIHSRKMKN